MNIDFNRTLLVKDTPASVREALTELGKEDEHTVTVREAIALHAQWELGDPTWGHQFFDLITDMAEEQSNE